MYGNLSGELALEIGGVKTKQNNNTLFHWYKTLHSLANARLTLHRQTTSLVL